MALLRLGRVSAGAAAGLFVLGTSEGARAYSTESVVSDPCHEEITMSALRAVRIDEPLAAPTGANRDERAMLEDLPFDLDSDLQDVAAATLILANRDVDLHGNEPNDLEELAPLHGSPDTQREHCLRRPNQDEPDGARLALEECRAFIREKVDSALDGLTDMQGPPDPTKRLELDIFLEFRGSVEVDLPHFYVELGRALHTLQDGFSHSYRGADDQSKVVTVLNYVEYAEDTLVEPRDGPPHSSPLDRCRSLDARRTERVELAQRASYELIRAALDPTTDDPAGASARDKKLAAVDTVLNRYFSLDESGCSVDNGWCGTPDVDYVNESRCVCTTAGAGGRSSTLLGLLVTGGLVFQLARRSWRRHAARSVMGAVLLLGLLGSREASAQEPSEPSAEPTAPSEAPASTPPPAEPPGDMAEQGGQAVVDGSDSSPGVVDASPVTESRVPFPLGAHIGGGASLQKGAFAASLGVRYRLNSSWLIGLDGEYNPWLSLRNFDTRPGLTNVYAVGILRFPLRFQRVNLRSTLQLGVSRMNFDLTGVPRGSIGPYIGFNLLGIDVELSSSIKLIVDPSHIAIPIPQTTGVPFVYPQYRFTVGFQFGA